MFTLNSLWDFFLQCRGFSLSGSGQHHSHRFERPTEGHHHPTESLLSGCLQITFVPFRCFSLPPPPHLQRQRVDGLPLIAFVAGVIELGWSISEGAWGYMLHTKRARSTLQRSAASSSASGRKRKPSITQRRRDQKLFNAAAAQRSFATAALIISTVNLNVIVQIIVDIRMGLWLTSASFYLHFYQVAAAK